LAPGTYWRDSAVTLSPLNHSMEAIILAGGAGTRLKQVVSDLPKPMAPIHNRPFLEYLMDYWIGQGVSQFILAVGFKAELIQKHFGKQYQNCDVVYSIEKDYLGTGGGFLKALSLLKEPREFLALNGDTFFRVSLKSLQAFHQEKKSMLSIGIRKLNRPERFGSIKVDGNFRITSFEEQPSGKENFINGGVYLSNAEIFDGFKERKGKISLEREVFPKIAEAGKPMFGFETDADFIDIGTPGDYEQANTFFT